MRRLIPAGSILLVLTLGGGPGAVGAQETPTTPTEILVRTLDGHRPVPHANVWVLRPGRLGPEQGVAMASGLADWQAFFEEHGERHVADERGRVVVTLETGETVELLGQGEGHWGLSYHVARDDADKTLLLPRDLAAPVQVVDGEGRPVAGVPVGLRLRDGLGDHDQRPVLTDAQGRAELAHVLGIERRLEPVTGVFAWIAAPLDPPVEAEIDLQDVERSLRLTLPPHGHVHVDVPAAGGGPGGAEVRAYLLATFGAGEREPAAPTRLVFEVEDGGVDLGPVGLGVELGLRLLTARGSQLAAAAYHGPERAGERLTLTLSARAPAAVSGRLLRPNRTPLARASFEVRPVAPARPEDGVEPELAGKELELDLRELVTGEDGGFRLELGDVEAERATALLFDAALRGNGDGGAFGRCELPRSVSSSTIELGDVVMREPVLLVEGLALDASGEPLAGAFVQVHYRSGEVPDAWHWDDLTTGADGRFRAVGRPAEGPVEVRLFSASWSPASGGIEVAAGTRGVRLVEPGSGTLVYEVLLDEEVDPERVFLRAVWEEASQSVDVLATEGELELFAGTHTVLVKSVSEESLATREDVRIVPGERAVLPPFDLRGRLRPVDLLVRDPDGEPVAGAYVGVRADGEGYVGLLETDSAGRVRLDTARPTVDVLLEATGHRTMRLAGVVGTRVIELPRGLPVHVELDGPELHPDETFVVCLSTEEELWRWDGAGRLGTRGDVPGVLHLPEPGTYGVHVLLRRGAHFERELPLGSRSIEVTDATVPVHLPIGVDAATVEALR